LGILLRRKRCIQVANTEPSRNSSAKFDRIGIAEDRRDRGQD
jgi:hypothetical protein